MCLIKAVVKQRIALQMNKAKFVLYCLSVSVCLHFHYLGFSFSHFAWMWQKPVVHVVFNIFVLDVLGSLAFYVL